MYDFDNFAKKIQSKLDRMENLLTLQYELQRTQRILDRVARQLRTKKKYSPSVESLDAELENYFSVQ